MATLRRAPNKGDDMASAADQGRDEGVVSDTPAATPRTKTRARPTIAKDEQVGARIPTVVQFPLVAVISFATASLGYSVLGELTKGELATVSRTQETWEEVALLATWRIFELALSWFGKLDSLDVAMMDLLSHGPSIYLLAAFYNLSPTTALAALAVDIVSASVPFCLLRPLSAVHKPSSSALPNRELIDMPLQLLTTSLSTSIYTVTLVLSLRFVLPRVLVLYFNGLPSVEPAYMASYSAVLPVTLLFGAAASTFIFAPFATTGRTQDDELVSQFDPVKATLGQTVWWNLWGYTTKTKVVIRRTAVTALVTGINTYLSCKMTIPGVESAGAAAYAAVWVLAALCTGVGLGLVGSDE
ncbi:hypothetical protein PT974_08280 [Cladobotryum mycophilum]|uniref:Uncharacterized protein n=1 Tax=Cladobotryum mycophilum TaxID=491253 RepID=A0ABR0SDW0_9HYPO